MLGPLARFAYDAGMEPAAFVAWRRSIGLLGLVAYVAWRVRRGATRLVRLGDLSAGRAGSLFVAASRASRSTWRCSSRSTGSPSPWRCSGFYTYPAMVAVANVVARPRAARPGAGHRARAGDRRDGRGRRLAARSGRRGSGSTSSASALALGAAVSQTVFVVISRDGYSEVPTEQAMSAIMLVTVRRRAPGRRGRRRRRRRSCTRSSDRRSSRCCSSPGSPRRRSRRSRS